jgi:hypothetical protein
MQAAFHIRYWDVGSANCNSACSPMICRESHAGRSEIRTPRHCPPPPQRFKKKFKLERQDTQTEKQIPWPLVRKRTIPTERLPLVGEILVPTFADRRASYGQGRTYTKCKCQNEAYFKRFFNQNIVDRSVKSRLNGLNVMCKQFLFPDWGRTVERPKSCVTCLKRWETSLFTATCRSSAHEARDRVVTPQT